MPQRITLSDRTIETYAKFRGINYQMNLIEAAPLQVQTKKQRRKAKALAMLDTVDLDLSATEPEGGEPDLGDLTEES